ncbi:MAG: DUF459 domain-containing protein [Myxococcales bacterium]|nr:DUF459 domain-containing protein [Myxococcales bacterium]
MRAVPSIRPLVRLPLVTLALALALAPLACSDKKVGSGEPTAANTRPPAVAIVPDEDLAEPAPAQAAGDEAAGEPEAVAAGTPLPSVADDEGAEAADEAPTAVADGPRRVLILGDSLAATGFGALLERRLDGHPDIECFRKAKSSSGLARPDFYDWMSEAKAQVKARDPHLVVVIMGGNDGQDLTTKNGKGKRVHWKTDEWNEAYRERVASFLDELRGDGRRVLWLGLPRTGTTAFEKKLELIRDVQQNATAEFEDVEYLDTSPYFEDDKGNLQEKADVGKKRQQALRADDGIHFTMAGSEYFAERVYPEVLRVIGVAEQAG